MRIFAKVIECGGFAAAARALDLSAAVVTRAVADLEAHLGARLIQRTTRRLSLTDTGEAYLDRVRQILSDIDEAEALAQAAVREPSGHLRVVCPPAFAVHQLAKHLPRFRQQFPRITLELTVPGPVETVHESHDVSILMLGRKPLDGHFVARRLARSEVVTCAAPQYLQRRGRPQHPQDLLQHESLLPPPSIVQGGITFQRGVDERGQALEAVTLEPGMPVLASSHLDTTYAAALAGMGVAGLPSFVVADALIEGALERVLPQWQVLTTRIYAAIPTRKHLPARTRVFLDFLVDTFGGEDRDPWLEAAGCQTPSSWCGAPQGEAALRAALA
ncbi:LysR family transcriptional regulator [Caldimonas sp.]